MWSITDEQAMHKRRYTLKELRDKLQQAGFHYAYSTSFVSLLFPMMYLTRKRKAAEKENIMNQLSLPAAANKILEIAMTCELQMIQAGVRFPCGGSLLVVAKKR
jgi:hypothetical protein